MSGHAYGVISMHLFDAFYHENWGGVVFLYFVVAGGIPRRLAWVCIPCQEVDAQWIVDEMIADGDYIEPVARWN